MKYAVTYKMLLDWAGPGVLKDAEISIEKGNVLEASFEPPFIKGSVLANGKPLKTSLKILPDGMAESLCPCWTNTERAAICSHVIAVALVLVKRSTDPNRDMKYNEELRRASRLASIDDSKYMKRVHPGTPGAMPVKIKISVPADWQTAFRAGRVGLLCEIEYQGKRMLMDNVQTSLPLSFSKEDESLLFVLEDIAQGPSIGSLDVCQRDFLNVLKLCSLDTLTIKGSSQLVVNKTRLTTYLQMDMDRENGELILIAHTEVPSLSAGQFPYYLVNGKDGFVFGDDNFWPLEKVLPNPYHSIYEKPVILARTDVLRFMRHELPLLSKFVRIESDISIDLFTVDPAVPRFNLVARGSPASLAVTLYATYESTRLIACKQDSAGQFGIPDEDDIMRYLVRNTESESQALNLLAGAGFRGETGDTLSSIVGNREVLNFLGRYLPALRRRRWQITLEGKVNGYMESIEFATPIVHVSDSSSGDWFDVGFNFEDAAGSCLSSADIQSALLKGESFIKKGQRTILIDANAIDSMQSVFSDCASSDGSNPGSFRLSRVYAPFVKASLDALDGIDVEDTPSWREKAMKGNFREKLEPVMLGEPLNSILRSYQKDGVNWLRFLEENGFCGLLADEMGLGKTVQALAWLQLTRCNRDANNKPALIVCPTSIVENWAEESARFSPNLKVLVLAGADRHIKWDLLNQSNIVITSYALLRRDLDNYLENEFSVILLDEAQHIKNRSTQNALAAKRLHGYQKLVLTGTPVENSVSDLWSIMDFLMPGYLGSHDSFRHNYEIPISDNSEEGASAQAKLRRKLHPFLLRRLKSDVAKDLPPKIEKRSVCALTPDQMMVYNGLLAASKKRVSEIGNRNFNKCRMEILTLLMRLRQTCCHLDLLKLPGLKAEHPSAKMDLFFELLDEAMDSGHRILVFSQFVSMLHIIRTELESRNLSFCYLDGSTKDRMQVVHKFNTSRDIPLFLISLKAGGTGLNLTGADMVVHFDPWWNPAVEDQATDRAYRIGQKRTVYSIKLITRGTVEEKVVALQQKKKAVINATLDNDDKVMQTMTWDDIREIMDL